MNCDNCKNTRTCTRVWRNSKKDCPHYIQMTNADHIRSMTDEELADFLVELADDGNLLIREWIKQPYKEN